MSRKRACNAVDDARIIEKCREINDTYIGKYRGVYNNKKCTIVRFICNAHKDKGIQERDWDHFKRYKKGCKYCHGKNKTTDDFKKEIFAIQPNIIILNEYTGSDTQNRIYCKCSVCGYEWDTSPATLRNGSGCPMCANRSRSLKEQMSQGDFEAKLSKVQPNLKIIGEYCGTHKLISVKCLKHNVIWESYPANLLNKSSQCKLCRSENADIQSTGEKIISDYLTKRKYTFQYDKSLNGCKFKRLLRFDFYIPEINVCIEYDGEQHYMPVTFNGISKSASLNRLLNTQKRDSIKNKYCQDNEIKLIRIPYWEKDRIEMILDSELNNSDPQRLSHPA